MIYSQLNRLLEDTYQIYEVLLSLTGEVLVCCRYTRNCHDPFTVATCKGTTVVRHLPSLLLCWESLGLVYALLLVHVAVEHAGGSKVATELKFVNSSTPHKFCKN